MDASVMTPENVRLAFLLDNFRLSTHQVDCCIHFIIKIEPLLFKDERPRGNQHGWMTIMTKLRQKVNHTGCHHLIFLYA